MVLVMPGEYVAALFKDLTIYFVRSFFVAFFLGCEPLAFFDDLKM